MAAIRRLAPAVAGLLLGAAAAAAEPDHGLWDVLLREHAANGLVDYAGLAAHRLSLDRYLASLESTDLATLTSREAQLAFWINAYNACVIRQVLDRPAIGSVKQIRGFFSEKHCPAGGAARSLDEIERQARVLGDWRVGVALACARSSGPLRAEAYVPERIDAQLADQTASFLRDPKRGLRLDGKTLRLSPIFKRQFAKADSGELLLVLLPYLDPTLADAIRVLQPKVRYLDYDWTLNAQRRPR